MEYLTLEEPLSGAIEDMQNPQSLSVMKGYQEDINANQNENIASVHSTIPQQHLQTTSETTTSKALNVLRITQEEIVLDSNAFNSVLDKVGDTPVVIYSISGATRTGKSYLLNFFIKYFESQKQLLQHNLNPAKSASDAIDENWVNFPLSSEFVWRSGKERETTGIHLWSEPYFVPTKNNGQVAVLLMDTQGLFDDKTTARQNAIIFSLTTLCSSVTIFNVMRQVNEDLLQQIQYFSSYAKMVTADSTTGAQDDPTFDSKASFTERKPFQNLVLLLRDCEIAGYNHGHHGELDTVGTGSNNNNNNFFRDEFHLSRQPPNCPKENTVVREGILQNFERVSAYLLPDPGKEFVRGSNNPDDDFMKELKSFIEHMVSPEHLVIKSVNGSPWTGTGFKEVVSCWGRLITVAEETFPEVFTTAENTAFRQYCMAKELAVSWYTQKMNGLLVRLQDGSNLTRDELTKYMTHYRLNAWALFQSTKKFPTVKFDESFKTQVEKAIDDHDHSSYCSYQINNLLEKSVETFPEMPAITDRVLRNQYTIAKDISMKHYEDKINDFLTTPQHVIRNSNFFDDFKHAHEEYGESAKEMFRRLPKFLNVKFDEEFEIQMTNEISEHYEIIRVDLKAVSDRNRDANVAAENQVLSMDLHTSEAHISPPQHLEKANPEAWLPWLWSYPAAFWSGLVYYACYFNKPQSQQGKNLYLTDTSHAELSGVKIDSA